MNINEIEILQKTSASKIPYHLLHISEINDNSIKSIHFEYFEEINGSLPLHSSYYKAISRLVHFIEDVTVQEIIIDNQ